MNNTMGLNYAEIETIASSIETSSENMKTALNNFNKTMDTLFTEGWQSNAATKYSAKIEELQASFNTFYEKVSNFASTLHTEVQVAKNSEN